MSRLLGQLFSDLLQDVHVHQQVFGYLHSRLELLHSRGGYLVRGLIPEEPNPMQDFSTVLGQLTQGNELIDTLAEVVLGRALLFADSLHERTDADSGEDGLLVEQRGDNLPIDREDTVREIVVMFERLRARATREQFHVLDGLLEPLSTETSVLGGRPTLPERDPAAALTLDDLELKIYLCVIFGAGSAHFNRGTTEMPRLVLTALALYPELLALRRVIRDRLVLHSGQTLQHLERVLGTSVLPTTDGGRFT